MTIDSGTFKARSGEAIAYDLYLPDATPARAVLLCQGLSGLKSLVLPDVARAFATAGFAALTFDYRGFGDSEGAKGWVDPQGRLSDSHDAFDYLSSRSEVTGIPAVYGLSLGGGIAYALAAERRVAAVAVTGGFACGTSLMRSMRSAADFIAFKSRLEENRRNRTDEMVPITDLFPFSPAFLKAYDALPVKDDARHSSSMPQQNLFHLASGDLIMRFDALSLIHKISPTPVLIQHGSDDDTTPIEDVLEIYRRAGEPKQIIIRDGGGHVNLDSGPGFDAQVSHAVAFFKQNLV